MRSVTTCGSPASALRRVAAVVGVLAAPCGCQPELVVGELLPVEIEPSACADADGGANGLNDEGMLNEGLLPAPWQTSFEDGLCGYYDGAGFCYAGDDSAYRVVTTPVRTGGFAAAFELDPGVVPGIRQTRCVREGVLPGEAYYGAWYYLPVGFGGAQNWNLLHFRGGTPGEPLRGLWDVSIEEASDGTLSAYLFDHDANQSYVQLDPTPIPLGRWFQLEMYLKRAADATGEVALYQDGVELVSRAGIVTGDTAFGQWYVGNYTATFSSSTQTSASLYVDDVAVRIP